MHFMFFSDYFTAINFIPNNIYIGKKDAILKHKTPSSAIRIFSTILAGKTGIGNAILLCTNKFLQLIN